MLAYQLTQDAQNDLQKIRHYTFATWGQAQSKKYLQSIQATIHGLCEFPLQGRLRPELAEGVRSFPVAGHVIYYFTSPKKLTVFAVLHGRMVPFEHLKNRDS